jgi:hypothetical protein
VIINLTTQINTCCNPGVSTCPLSAQLGATCIAATPQGLTCPKDSYIDGSVCTKCGDGANTTAGTSVTCSEYLINGLGRPGWPALGRPGWPALGRPAWRYFPVFLDRNSHTCTLMQIA